jgi:hypothetical protein
MNKQVSEKQGSIEVQSSYHSYNIGNKSRHAAQIKDLCHTGQVPWLIVLWRIVTSKGQAGQHQGHELGIGKHAKEHIYTWQMVTSMTMGPWNALSNTSAVGRLLDLIFSCQSWSAMMNLDIYQHKNVLKEAYLLITIILNCSNLLAMNEETQCCWMLTAKVLLGTFGNEVNDLVGEAHDQRHPLEDIWCCLLCTAHVAWMMETSRCIHPGMEVSGWHPARAAVSSGTCARVCLLG